MKKFLVSMAVAALAIPALAQSSAPARVRRSSDAQSYGHML